MGKGQQKTKIEISDRKMAYLKRYASDYSYASVSELIVEIISDWIESGKDNPPPEVK